MANVAIINKVNNADPKSVEVVQSNLKLTNPDARVIKAASDISIDKPELVKGKRVLVVEDGPTVTHGNMAYGVGFLAAKQYQASQIVDPRKSAVGIIASTFTKYPHLQSVLPTMGYGQQQIRDLEATISRVDCDSIVIATPADIRRLIKFSKPTARVSYELREIAGPTVEDSLRSAKII